MFTVRVAFTDDVDGKTSGSGGEYDTASATTLSLPEMRLMFVVKFATSKRNIVCRGDLSMMLEAAIVSSL